ncbi:hypothetical protein DNK57_05950 [Methanothermobacter thermautotrophicus]|uniref:Oligosaccharide repeat unit polymerase n=1 Tax=Methanothermobacter thermautotrophicus TaxID=145262 RepID=A0A842YN00_METTF|nr:hypothetical protein [Methanothermobacter thermautotrophicus]MBE2900338.1 hypothetical protein [Methanothermobacter thermautotrophicus]MCQ8904995.1 hypothetical protein [Methanothermobacter sp.]
MLIAQNNLQFILEVALIIHVGIILLFNVVAVPLSLVMFLGTVLTVILALIFSADAAFLLLPFLSHHEFTHPFGPFAVLFWVTMVASSNLLTEAGIGSASVKKLSLLLFFVIAISGGLMHRSFLVLWLLGWAFGYLLMSKSFRRSTRITRNSVISFILAGVAGFALLEFLSRVLNKSVLSPMLRITRLEENTVPSLSLVLKNTTFWGHVQGSCYWKSACLGGADGYITLPVTMIQNLGLPYHIFYGVLVVKKDYIDYMLPGIFAVAFDAGFFGLLFLLSWVMIVTFSGLTVLRKYQEQRLNGSRMYLGREALLIGSLAAFLSQSIVGLFIFNRSFNSAALLTYIIISALVMAHTVTVKRTIP